MIVEILRNSLYQSDADQRVLSLLAERGIKPTFVIDLHGLEAAPEGCGGGVAYVRWPIEDGPLPNLAILGGLEMAAARVVHAGGAVVTMCNMGRNRSGLVSALVVARVQQVTGTEAVAFVRAKCPEALSNEMFADYVRSTR